MITPWRVGIAGLGAAGQMLLTESSLWSENAMITCGMDINGQTLERAASRYGIASEETLEGLCERDDVDIVYIATPTPLHAEHAICAAEHGKHVMVEKPLAWSIADCDRLIETALAHDVYLMAVHTPSFNAPVIAMRQLIASQQLGPVLQVTSVNYAPWLIRPRLPDELDFSLGGGVCGRQAPHQIDMVWYLVGGRPEWVRSGLGHVEEISAGDGHYSALIGFSGGAVASIIYNGYGYFDTTEMTHNVGHLGRLEAPGAGARLRMRETMAKGASRPREVVAGFADERVFQPAVGWLLVSCARGDIAQSPTGLVLYDGSGRHELACAWSRSPFEEALRELIAAAEGRAPLLHDGAWGRTVLQVCHGIHSSAELGVEIRIPA